MVMGFELTQEEVNTWLNYDPKTGELTWKIYWNGKRAGERAGSIYNRDASSPRCEITVECRKYSLGRFIWFYVTGEWPDLKLLVHHKNGDKRDFAWENLELVTRNYWVHRSE